MAEKETELQKINRIARGELSSMAVAQRIAIEDWYGVELSKGRANTVYSAEDVPFDRTAWIEDTKAITVNAMIEGTNVGLEGAYIIANVQNTSKYYLGLTLDSISLSDRIREASYNAEKLTLDAINQHIERKTTWQRLTKELTRRRVSKGDLPAYLTELAEAARSAGNDTAELRKLIKKANSSIEKLAGDNAPTTRLKKAYSKVVRAVESGDQKALSLSLQNAIDKKAVYNNERISRSELARANNMAFVRRFRDHPLYDSGKIYVKHRLSSRHVIYDECNYYAEADTLNLGAGVWDEKHAPRIPIHANCLCGQSIVAIDVDKRKHQFSEERSEMWIKKQSEKRQEILRKRLAENEMLTAKPLPKDQVIDVI